MTQPNNPEGNGVPEGANGQNPEQIDPTASAPWEQPSAQSAPGWGAPQGDQAAAWGAPPQQPAAPQQPSPGQQPSAQSAPGWGAPQGDQTAAWGAAPQQPSAPDAGWGAPAAAGASADAGWGTGSAPAGGDAWGTSSQSYGTPAPNAYGGAAPYGGSGGPGGPGYSSYGGGDDTPKKSLTWLWALLGALVLIGAVVGILFATGVLGGKKEASQEDLQALYTSCQGGDAQACEDLYQSAPEGSAEYLYGETCGNRTDGTVECTADVMSRPADSWTGVATGPTTPEPVDPTTEPVTPTTEPVTPTTDPVAPTSTAEEVLLMADWLSECQGGNMTSCDLVFFYSAVGSDEEAVAVSCGGNADAAATGGPCSGFNPDATDYGTDATLDALYDQCSSGTMRACDDLYFLAASGTGYQAFGETCGGRQAAGYTFYCSQ